MANQELKVLLIEDNPGDAFLIKFYLGESTEPVFHLSHAETLQAALDLLEGNKFDLILSDMNLADSFGVDTVKSILGKFPGNLVVVLTGLTDEEVGLETVRYGAQDFLVKGKFDGKILISSVMFAFERFKLHKQIDKFSKQLDQENSRLDNIQRLLLITYFEFDKDTITFPKPALTLEIGGIKTGNKNTGIEDILGNTEEPEKINSAFRKILDKGGNGEFKFKRKHDKSEYRLVYEGTNGKFCGIVQKIS